MKRTKTALLIAIAILILGTGGPAAFRSASAGSSGSQGAAVRTDAFVLPIPSRLSHGFDVPIGGNPETLEVKYERWKASIDEGATEMVIGLHWSKALSVGEPVAASGRASINLLDGTVAVEVKGVDEGTSLDAWLVDNGRGPGRSVRVAADDRAARLGGLGPVRGGRAALALELPRTGFADFTLDQVVITRAGRTPREGGILFGAPTLFQRRYFAELEQARSAGLALQINPTVTESGGATPTCASPAEELVAYGEYLFFNEKFQGNDRVCGSCHPATNNYTLDPDYIATLPAWDPLFVAEFNPDLMPENTLPRYNRRFEIPTLMRSDALILANVDGDPGLDPAEDDRFVMRSVPHLFGLALTTTPYDEVTPPDERLGWGGDGSPVVECGQPGGEDLCGTLHDFAIGAIRQHLPRTLLRRAAPSCAQFDKELHDFCLPDDDQLCALEAFMLSLGRRSELPQLTSIELRDPIANAKVGFVPVPPGQNSNCTICHQAAGAGAADFVPSLNPTMSTGVETLLQNEILNAGNWPDPDRPPDGGFGYTPDGSFGTPTAQNPPLDCGNVDNVFTDPCDYPGLTGSFGKHSFNSVSTIEAADTPPFYHGNNEATLEDAIAFYLTAEFNDFAIHFLDPGIANQQDVESSARFLRVLNSLDNLDSQAAPPAERALGILNDPLQANGPVNTLLMLSIANLQDTIDVLRQDENLHEQGQLHLQRAITYLGRAILTPSSLTVQRAGSVQDGLDEMCAARQDMECAPCPWDPSSSDPC